MSWDRVNTWEHDEDDGDFAMLDAESAYKTRGYPDSYRWLNDMPYERYLRSDHWQFTRRRALLRAGGQCQLCEATGSLNVHHLTYRRRGREKEKDVMVLCYPCHGWVHANADRATVLRWVNIPHAKIILQSDAAAADWARRLEQTEAALDAARRRGKPE